MPPNSGWEIFLWGSTYFLSEGIVGTSPLNLTPAPGREAFIFEMFPVLISESVPDPNLFNALIVPNPATAPTPEAAA